MSSSFSLGSRWLTLMALLKVWEELWLASFACPSRYTWTVQGLQRGSESLVPRAGHRRDRNFYLICL